MTSTAVAIPDKAKWKQEIQRFDETKYLVLAPIELGHTPAMHTPMVSVVSIDPDPKGGDVHELAGKFAYSKASLDRIAAAAGICWLPENCGRTDNGADPEIVRFRMSGKRKELDGQWRVVTREYEFDLAARQAELEASAANKNANITDTNQRQRAIDAYVAKEMVQLRKFKVQRAESGAANRVTRVFLGIKASYTGAQIARPVVIPKLVFTPDYSDPDVKKFMLAEATGTIKELYAAQAESARGTFSAPIEIPESREELGDGSNRAALTSGGTGGQTQQTSGETGQLRQDEKDEASFREAYNAGAEALQGLDLKDPKVQIPKAATEAAAAQLAVLERMLARKGKLHGCPVLKKPIEQFTPEQRLALFQRLYDLPDPAPAAEEPAFA